MQHTPQQNKLFHEALIAAYVDFQFLRIMIRRDLNDPLDDITPELPKTKGVAAVIQWAVAEDKLQQLSDALIKDKPNNPKVKAYRESLNGTLPQVLPPANFETFAVPQNWSGKASGLEALVQKDNRLELATEWAAAMKQAQSRVCRIEAPEGTAVGTGFLVGFDLILTNCHVYRLIENQPAVARFDYFAENSPGTAYGINQPYIAVSTEDKLDFALLHLASKVEPARGKFTPKVHEFKRGQVQLILQHASGNPLKLGIGQVTMIDDLHGGVFYDPNTEPGSSGSPVFTMNWELVAIHHFGSSNDNRGVPLAPIWKRLATEGHI